MSFLKASAQFEVPAEAELLAKQLADIDYIPGIDLPSDSNKKSRLGSEERDLREAEQQNAEFDKEADRLFGDDSGSEEASDEDAEMEEEEDGDEEEMSENVSEENGSPQLQSAQNGEQHSPSGQQDNEIKPDERSLDAASELHASQGMASVALDKPPEGTQEAPSAAVLSHLQ